MKWYKSKFGWFLAIIYLVYAVSTFAYSEVCTTPYCGLQIIFPMWPWSFFDFSFIQSQHLDAFILVSFTLNAVILYILGYGIEKLWKKHKLNPSPNSGPPASE